LPIILGMEETKSTTINRRQGKLWIGLALSIILPILLLQSLRQATAASTTLFGYGANVAEWDITKLDSMGFNWIKVFNGPGSRLPLNVLMRVEANASHLADLNGFGDGVAQLAQQQKGFVEAYEIGNEPNLDATYGWGYGNTNVPPNAADYAAVLCEAYGRIKAVDPDVLIVSAGLAPTGRVMGTWNGHAGHNGLYQDERIFAQELLDAMQTINGAPCFDVFGYHPYGYSANFDAEPDVASADPAQDCANGFCFRSVEKIYDILQANGLGDKQIFATEFGWITEPPANCLTTAGWPDRVWQIVSEQKQADNLVGAYEYATTNYPWMGGMFIFNLNFNTAPWITNPCEQMRFYSVVDRPAEAALAAMPKVAGAGVGELSLLPGMITAVYTPTQQPISQTVTVTLKNSGSQPLAYTITLQTMPPLTLTLSASLTGTLDANQETAVPLQYAIDNQPTGSYTGTMRVETVSNGVATLTDLPITVYLWGAIFQTFLPFALRP